MTGSLSGYTIGVTADRRSDEQIALLSGRGAATVHGPTIRTHPLRPEAEIAVAVQQLLAEPPSILVASTGIGVRGMFEAADALLVGEQLRMVLQPTRVFARGPKAHGAAVTVGLDVEWSAPSATMDEVFQQLRTTVQPGDRIAVQVDGGEEPQLLARLADLGADVVAVPVYRWTLPEDVGPAETLMRAIVDLRVDAVTFTARPAVENFITIAEDADLLDAVRRALHGPVTVFSVGPVCSSAILAHDLGEPVQPERFRLGALVMAVTSTLSARNVEHRIGGSTVSCQGRRVVVDDEPPADLSARERQVLDALLERPGVVLSKQQLLADVWAGTESDAHVVEVTVGRLRRRLGPAGPGIETVLRRGYRVSAE